MCGIFGFVGKIPREKAGACLDTLSHRGPDGRGLFQQDAITLGHRRLSILDLSERGHQPMSTPDGRYWITFNGEIYNFVEIRKELSNKYSFRSESDTEVILAAFELWGEECLHRFNGMWALAIWDTIEQKLFLSRDRFGKKPLFYTSLNDGFAFASEMKALLPLLTSISPNEELIRDTHRIFTYESTSDCLIRGIQRFPAGHRGWFHKGSLRLERWWNTLDHIPETLPKYEDQVARFRELFIDSCRLRMRSDVPLGTALSGGLDSSATITTMAHLAKTESTERMGQSWQHAFVASFPGSDNDETKFAQQVTDYIGIPSTVISVDPLKSIGMLAEYFRLFEEIYITSPIPFMLTYGAIKANGVTVTLDGHGADELFGGYTFNYLNALRDAGPLSFKAKDILDTFYSSQFPNANHLPPKLLFFLNWQARDIAKRLLGRGRIASVDSGHPNWSRFDHLNRILYVSSHETILPTLLRNYDRYSMANGVEIRMPFMDHRLVTFAFSLPWTSKIRNGFSKAIIRDAVADLMPKSIAYRKAKVGFNSPIVDWMKRPLRPFFLDILASSSFKTCSLINATATANMVCKVIDEPTPNYLQGEAAWTALTPYFWEQTFLKGLGLP